MAQKRNYNTKQKGKTEVYPFWNMEDLMNVINWFKNNEEWDGYLTSMLLLLLGRRVGDTMFLKWSDFYYENGEKKREIDTIVEQKTGKTVLLPVTDMVFEAIEMYVSKTGRNIMEEYDGFIFNVPCKDAWIERANNPVYSHNDLEEWCEFLNKDLSDKRKEKIIEGFRKQKEWNSLGEYLYNEVETDDIRKWQQDGYRKLLNKAVKDCGINYRVGCHSFRKTFGYISKMIHPDDPNSMLILQSIYGHSSQEITMEYIGLSEDRKRQYFDDMGDVVRRLENGDTDLMVNNSPIVSFRHEDLRSILTYAIGNRENGIEILNDCLSMVDDLKVKAI